MAWLCGGILRERRARSDSLEWREEAMAKEPSVRKKPARSGGSLSTNGSGKTSSSPSTKSGSEVTMEEELQLVSFPSSVQVARLPLVIFDDEVEEQLIWEHGAVEDGQVIRHGPPDIRVKNPVVMSNAFKGFVVQPYELRYLQFRGVGVVFARPSGGRFMQPSIDTILVCRGVMESLQNFKVRRIIDVGSGSGFIGKFCGHHARGAGDVEVTLVDIDPMACSYYKNRTFNSNAATATGRRIEWKFCSEDAVSLLERDDDYDLIVSNPPYIPTKPETLGAVSPLSRTFWEGVGLVLFLLKLIEAKKGARLVMMVTSLTLKAPNVLDALEDVVKKGGRVNVLLEREIAWKAWYAGPNALDHLLATEEEEVSPHEVAGCRLFVGATRPGRSRTKKDGRDGWFGYHWHVAYVLEIQA